MSEHHLLIKEFLGIDNTSDLASVSVRRRAGIFFYKINNVDIDDAGKAHRRDGYGSPIYPGSSIRSLWANDKICLFADGTNLKFLNDYNIATSIIGSISPTDTFSYVANGNIVYFSSMSIIGYIDANTVTPSPFPDPYLLPIKIIVGGNVVEIPNPALKFKIKMVGGQILEFYNSRLYAANACNLFFSDATIPTQMDNRKNAIAFPSRITMVKAVDNGMFVSDSERVYFQAGLDPSEFAQRKVLDVPAIEGMSIANPTKGKAIAGKSMHNIVYWMTRKGIYAGHNDGVVVPQQLGLYNVNGLVSGAAVIKDGTYQQLLMIGKY